MEEKNDPVETICAFFDAASTSISNVKDAVKMIVVLNVKLSEKVSDLKRALEVEKNRSEYWFQMATRAGGDKTPRKEEIES